ncbi:MAG: WecB/TagA/CpsF family glycosyltransferase, partial [Dehalococcoidia bacterium]
MITQRHDWPHRHLFDIRIDAVTMNDVLTAVDEAVLSRNRLLICAVNAAKIVHMAHDQALRRAVLGGDIIIADGMSVILAARLLLRRLPERVTGIDLMTQMLERANERRYRVYCLGATDDVLDCVVERIRRKYPGVVIAGTRNGYFADGGEDDVAREIEASRPDLLFVAMSSPKKERFLATHVATLNVPVCHGVGGAFDILAGKVRRAPRPVQRLGLEWLYRVVQEPRRMWRRYLVTNTLFVGLVAREVSCALGRSLRPSARTSLPRIAAGRL